MDHLQGLPFFGPLRRAGVDVHIWGPASTTISLRARLLRYLSPPLFPVSVRELPSNLNFHEVPYGQVEIGEFGIFPQLIIHYNPTVGYRITSHNASLTYLPDHEPALSGPDFPGNPAWTSGYDLARDTDLLIHDSQYTDDEYRSRRGFGHSTMEQAFHFAQMAGVKQLAPFHHDPSHSDDMIDEMIEQAFLKVRPSFVITPGQEGAVFRLG
jgi:ribonuclease BN (tRNA processing enzyme)